MSLSPRFSLLISCLLAFASAAPAQTIVAHRVKVRLKQVLDNVTGGHFGIGVGIDTASHAQIEFQDENGNLVARPFPIHMQGAGLGVTVIGEVDNNQLMSLYRTNGKRVIDLMGRYHGVRFAEALFSHYLSSRSTLYMNGNYVVLGDTASLVRGVGGDVSYQQMIFEARPFSESSDLPGDWNDTIEVR